MSGIKPYTYYKPLVNTERLPEEKAEAAAFDLLKKAKEKRENQ